MKQKTKGGARGEDNLIVGQLGYLYHELVRMAATLRAGPVPSQMLIQPGWHYVYLYTTLFQY